MTDVDKKLRPLHRDQDFQPRTKTNHAQAFSGKHLLSRTHKRYRTPGHQTSHLHGKQPETVQAFEEVSAFLVPRKRLVAIGRQKLTSFVCYFQNPPGYGSAVHMHVKEAHEDAYPVNLLFEEGILSHTPDGDDLPVGRGDNELTIIGRITIRIAEKVGTGK
jgi:hypothetical protein